jgi:hypothetical protein
VKLIEPKHILAVSKHLSDTPITMRALAKKLRCTLPTAMRRLAAWEATQKGLKKLKSRYVREGKRGFESVGYYL